MQQENTSYFLVVILSCNFFDDTSSLRSSTEAASPCAAQDSKTRALTFILVGVMWFKTRSTVVKIVGADGSYTHSRVAGYRAYEGQHSAPSLSEHASFFAVAVSRKAVTKAADLRCQERTLTPSEKGESATWRLLQSWMPLPQILVSRHSSLESRLNSSLIVL